MVEPALRFDPVELPPEAEAMRARVREFIDREVEAGQLRALREAEGSRDGTRRSSAGVAERPDSSA